MADLDNLHISVRQGDPTILFLHGLAGHHGEWRPVIGQLDAAIGVIAPDQRAHGRSFTGASNEGASIEGTSIEGTSIDVSRDAYVQDAADMIMDLGTDAIVVGQSMGGVVSTLLAAEAPDLVRHLVLIEAGMDAMTDEDLDGLRNWFDSWPQPFADRKAASEFFGADAPSTPAWVDGLEKTADGLMARFDPSQMVDTMRSLASKSRHELFAKIEVPITLIRAQDSTISDEDVARMLEAQPQMGVTEIAESGHDVHLDQPELVAMAISRIVAEDSSGTDTDDG